jgi:methylisocitrate lyase
MQTRAGVYATFGYHAYEALDASIITTVIPQGGARQDGGEIALGGKFASHVGSDA